MRKLEFHKIKTYLIKQHQEYTDNIQTKIHVQT